jgi:glycosyltransferase involved in cell wall biosynthesis
MEAISCGTPVLAFPVGGLPDLVRPGLTGWLADEPTSAALTVALNDAIRESRSIGKSCREIAEREYPMDLQAERYLNLFNELL